MLNDAERQSIREWFRNLVKARAAGDAGDVPESAGQEDLPLPRGLASDVKGGSSPDPPEPPEEP